MCWFYISYLIPFVTDWLKSLIFFWLDTLRQIIGTSENYRQILFLTLAVPLNNLFVDLVAVSLLLEQTDDWTFAGLTSIWSQENTDGAARSGLRGQWGLVCVDLRWQAPLSSAVMWKQSDRWFISHTEQRRHLKGRFHLDLILLLQIKWFNSGLLWSQFVFVVQHPPPQTPWHQAVSHGVWAERL